MSPARAYPAFCAHTHLFPGARPLLRELGDPAAFAAAPRPVGVELEFADGVVAAAELLVAGPGDAVLAVPAYTTAAGTRIAERTWPVRELRTGGDMEGGEVELVLGGRAA
ncbi:hypothetical protein [Streptomyces sp. NPDC005805]|uniref:hypothetical protein n=1 Tax=Streptomyces sp. NPDC005805 TaxID=3157068 RepID=UPI0034002B26